MTLPFTLKQLRVLTAIATEENFTKAAETLYMSQSSISKQIKILENELEILLIHKKHNRTFLTEGGLVFSKYAQRILALCEESCRILIDLKNNQRGNLKIGSSQIIGIHLMPHLLALLIKKCPQINLKVKVNSTNIIAKNIYNRKIDIAVVGGEISNEIKNDLKIENFVIDELNLIICNSHPFATKIEINKEDLYDLKFITLNSNSFIKSSIENILVRNKIQLQQSKIILRLNSIESIKTAVGFGLGAAFIFASRIEKSIKFKTVKIKNTKIIRTLSILSNPESYKSKSFEFIYNELYYLKNKIKI